MRLKFCDGWQLVGLFCANHVALAAQTYGTAKIQTLDKEGVEKDTRCNIHGCKEYVAFMVEKHV